MSGETKSGIIKSNSNSFGDFQIKVGDVWSIDLDLNEFNGRKNAKVHPISTEMSEQAAQLVLQRHTESRQDSISANSLKDSVSSEKSLDGFRKNSSSSVSMGVSYGPGLGIRLDDCHYSSVLKPKKSNGSKLAKFQELIESPVTDLRELKKISWYGIPVTIRHIVWKLLLGYLPPNWGRRQIVLEEKRRSYRDNVEKYYCDFELKKTTEMRSQIQKDLLRMSTLHEKPELQSIFERILYVWSVKHHASGYVQGINDLVMPFFVVFLSEYVRVDLNTSQKLILHQHPTEKQLNNVEADSFWCVSTLLDSIQDRYIFAQPGIQRDVLFLANLVEIFDRELHQHLTGQRIEYLQFALRWMNNLLMRELPLRCVIRLWDTYQAEEQGFLRFHVYVCAGLLLHLHTDLVQKQDFQSLLIFLQNLPTCHWTDEQINEILAQAFRIHSTLPDSYKKSAMTRVN